MSFLGRSRVDPYHKLTSMILLSLVEISNLACSVTFPFYSSPIIKSSTSEFSINSAGIVKLKPPPSRSSSKIYPLFISSASAINATYPPAYSICLAFVVIEHSPAFTIIIELESKNSSNGLHPF